MGKKKKKLTKKQIEKRLAAAAAIKGIWPKDLPPEED